MLEAAAAAVITPCLPAQYSLEIRLTDALLQRSAEFIAVAVAQADPASWLLTALHHIRSGMDPASWERAVRMERREQRSVCFGSYFPDLPTLISTLMEAVPESTVHLISYDGTGLNDTMVGLDALVDHPAALVAPEYGTLLLRNCYITFSGALPLTELAAQEVYVMLGGDEDATHESLLAVLSWNWRREAVAKCWHIPGLLNLSTEGLMLNPDTPCSATEACEECKRFGCGCARPHPHNAPNTSRSLKIHKRPFNRAVNAWKRSVHIWDDWLCAGCTAATQHT